MVTFAHGSVANRALRQMFHNPHWGPMSKLLSLAGSSRAAISIPRSSYCASADHRGGASEKMVNDPRLGWARSNGSPGKTSGVNLQESKQIVNRPALPAYDRR